VMQSADAGPQFEALRQSMGTTNTITNEQTLQWLQLALGIGKVTPAATAATTAQTTLNSATGAVNAAIDPALYGEAASKVNELTQALDGGSAAFGKIGEAAGQASGIIKEFLGATQSLADFLDLHTFHVKVEIDPIPSEFMPGSPTPFEEGLRGIADAAGHLNRVSFRHLQNPEPRELAMPSPKAAMRSVEEGGGRTSVIENTPITIQLQSFMGTREELIEAVHTGLLAKKRRNGRLSLGDKD
jgi:hypothetical protein